MDRIHVWILKPQVRFSFSQSCHAVGECIVRMDCKIFMNVCRKCGAEVRCLSVEYSLFYDGIARTTDLFSIFFLLLFYITFSHSKLSLLAQETSIKFLSLIIFQSHSVLEHA